MPIYECRYRNNYGDEVEFEIGAESLRDASTEAKKRLGANREFILVPQKVEV
jgi:hypothetical protein